MLEILRWISLAFLWAATALNIVAFVRCNRTNRQLKKACATMERLIKNWEEDHIGLEEDFDGRNN